MEKGKYKGFYQYNNEDYIKSKGFDRTYFTIEITNIDGKKFKGWVEDDLSTGGMEGRGTISGDIYRDRIYFVKQMPYLGTIVKNPATGEHDLKINKNRKHMPVYYEGYVGDPNEYTGKWNFRFYSVMINLIIMLKRIKTGGTWEMTKVIE